MPSKNAFFIVYLRIFAASEKIFTALDEVATSAFS